MNSLGIVVICLSFVVSTSGIVEAQTPPTRHGDRRAGEEEKIRQRTEWFVQHRGLDRISRADLKRRAAVLSVREYLDAEGGSTSLHLDRARAEIHDHARLGDG
jgi:hypothetical protein